ncbi:DUF4180 domain-containing protein [Oscillibacter sp.]|uniref:DUF4180 domain-containing protein n=1 Tax=Oscillibacter sp. TaxID=1945593 RepID=UPI0028A5C2C7|nr:DUF4180 domain-containing protein [Oscillibacter sp.]
MQIENIQRSGANIAVITGGEKVLTDVQSALDLLATIRYETGADRIAIDKDAVADDFFVLSTGLAGGVLQKFVTYHTKVAFYGDYTGYTSKPLRDFIYESNKGNHVFFVLTKEEALERLAGG